MEKILEFSQIKGSIKEVESLFEDRNLESWNEIKTLFESPIQQIFNVRINFGIVRGLDYYLELFLKYLIKILNLVL